MQSDGNAIKIKYMEIHHKLNKMNDMNPCSAS